MSYALIECEKKKFFPITDVEEVFDEVHIKLPELKEKQSRRYGRKINRILKKYQVSNVILSEALGKNEIIRNTIYMQNNYIITGNKLYKALAKRMIKDICSITEVPMETVCVAIFAHEFTIENWHLVKHVSKEVREIMVISENKMRFEKLSDDLMEKEGIALTTFDTSYQNHLRCHFVINVDFTEEELKKFALPKDAIIISVEENIRELRKNFNGIMINDVELYLDSEVPNFRTLALCEARFFDYRRNFEENDYRFEKSGSGINGYVGNNGFITAEDLKRVAKTFTKNSKNTT
ncbi:MAG: hypothetical protein IJ217_04160 [Clostridia bacterium]|nr:hypothetical protein [Clostridia bacterium]